ncbi:MAG: hypothetical protein GX624_04050 [Actinobacteria bacterium]|nr:hypothetical protein [Actinomycetota bacterium]
MSPAFTDRSARGIALRASFLLALAVAALVALSGDPHSGGAAGAAPAASAAGPAPAVAREGVPWAAAESYPAAYDLRDQGLLTGVRSQDNFSTCWILAATGALESSILRGEGLRLDFSENNLANHMASRLDYEGMAPSELAVAYYARWEGPVWESSDRYPRPGRSPAFLRAVRHVQDVLFLPARQGPLDNAAVKWAIMTYGGADAAVDFRVQDEYRSWNRSTNAYYNPSRKQPNHHVLIVGWDDTFSASKFLDGRRPPGDGAFLIKNSWGTDWGDKGFAWVSYYDATIGDAPVVFSGVEKAGNYDAVYQYDALGRSRWRAAGAGERAWFANRFTAAGDGAVTAVSFYTPVTGTAYEVRVTGSVAQVAAAPAAAAGVIDVPGYRTVRLDRPVAIAAGKRFVVAVGVTTPGWDRPVPVEAPSALISPRSAAGQSFVSPDGERWTDLTTLQGMGRANVNLKAFVDAAGAADSRAPRAEVRGGAVRRGAKARIRWRLVDPPFSSASAIVELRVRDAGGRLVAQRRIPAVAVGERGTWSFRVTWKAGRYSVRARAFDVSGRRSQASRATVVVRGPGASATRAAGR